jgi:hypothetical protein
VCLRSRVVAHVRSEVVGPPGVHRDHRAPDS